MSVQQADVVVGSIAPNFSLDTTTGSKISLSDYQGKQNVVLYFMREFMCLQCQGHVIQLGRLADQLKAQNTQVLIIGGGNPRNGERLTQMIRPPFPVLVDVDRSVYHKYDLDKVLFAIQRSGTFLIDKQGIVRYIHQVTNPGSSLNKAELLREVQKVQNS